MTFALHLAPLVAAGLVSSTIHMYKASVHNFQAASQSKMGGRQAHPGWIEGKGYQGWDLEYCLVSISSEFGGRADNSL